MSVDKSDIPNAQPGKFPLERKTAQLYFAFWQTADLKKGCAQNKDDDEQVDGMNWIHKAEA